MNNNIFRIAMISLVAVISVVGAVMAYNVISLGNPNGWKEDDVKREGAKIVYEEDLGKTVSSQEALDNLILEQGTAKKEALLKNQYANASSYLSFTMILIYVILGAVILALVYTGIINPKKLIIPAIGVAVVGILLFIIHSSATDVIPELYAEKEAIKLAENPKYLTSYTAENWKMAGASITSVFVLAGLAIIGLVVSSVVSIFK